MPEGCVPATAGYVVVRIRNWGVFVLGLFGPCVWPLCVTPLQPERVVAVLHLVREAHGEQAEALVLQVARWVLDGTYLA